MNEYVERCGATCLVVHDKKLGTTYVQLANFTGKVTREVTVDDGVTAAKMFTITGKLAAGAALPTIEVPASRWGDRTWVAEHGVRAP